MLFYSLTHILCRFNTTTSSSAAFVFFASLIWSWDADSQSEHLFAFKSQAPSPSCFWLVVQVQWPLCSPSVFGYWCLCSQMWTCSPFFTNEHSSRHWAKQLNNKTSSILDKVWQSWPACARSSCHQLLVRRARAKPKAQTSVTNNCCPIVQP